MRIALGLLVMLAATAIAQDARSVQAEFPPHAPGSYKLDRILHAPDGRVLDTRQRETRLSRFTTGKVTLFSLMYTACNDEKGCPLALFTLDTIKRQLERRGRSLGRVRLVSLSFDPDHDTPQVMRAYSGKRATEEGNGRKVPWHFLTAASSKEIAALLAGFDQDVSIPADPQAASREMKHLLKVFLIDRDGWVREIYSTAFLLPQVIANDIETLLLEENTQTK
jgi:cytochrome oxidase Cu insertion factor (SCO1/SenC/PrrC family)